MTAPSLWLETCGDDLTPRPPMTASLSADVAIVGAGFTGLWTAHHLLREDPTLRVVLVERHVAGWGASGRNGGWCSALFPVPWTRIARDHGPDAARRMERALQEVVDEIGEWCRRNGVDADYVKGGTLTLARGPAQLARLRAEGSGQWLDAEEATRRVAAAGVDGGVFNRHCAAIHPGRLVRGLARVVEAQGATIFEGTMATGVHPGRVVTRAGTLRANIVVRATEGYTADIPDSHRLLAPVWSLIIATEPLPHSVWSQIGWRERETLADERHLIIYAQRTADDRIVFGGRGAPYRFGSQTTGSAGHSATYAGLESALHELLPQTNGAAITHRWGGVIGVPRDFMPSVTLDRASGLAWAGGYVGDGVACTALAGQTLADLILGHDTDRTTLPWVGHKWRRWEPEPLRWLGVRGMTALMASADRAEARTGRPSRRAALLDRLTS
ncbi:MAG: FAD-dependent oxidoreductase [Frankiaceae bacterium]|nr:FAD-dependent oxidoreductase [Frankiaceae bacterium]